MTEETAKRLAKALEGIKGDLNTLGFLLAGIMLILLFRLDAIASAIQHIAHP